VCPRLIWAVCVCKYRLPEPARSRSGVCALQRAEKAKRLLQASGEVYLGAPGDDAPGKRVVNAATQLLARLGQPVLRRKVFAGDLQKQLVELVDAGL
jgi:hypothetical protein